MTDWVAVSVDLDEDPKVAAFAKVLGVHRDTAAMRMVRLWGRMARQAVEDGRIGHLEDDTLEEWAGWRGKRGKFARAFRDMFTVDGAVTGWWRWNGRLLRKARLERERKRALQAADIPPPTPPPIPRNRGGDSANNTGTGTRPKQTPTAREPLDRGAFTALLAKLPATGGDRWAITEFLEAVPGGKIDAWVPILTNCLAGLDMPAGRPCIPGQLATTCRDFMTKLPHDWTPKYFRTCVSALMRIPTTPGGPSGATERTIQAAEAFASEAP